MGVLTGFLGILHQRLLEIFTSGGLHYMRPVVFTWQPVVVVYPVPQFHLRNLLFAIFNNVLIGCS